jgi:hypothetical protein
LEEYTPYGRDVVKSIALASSAPIAFVALWVNPVERACEIAELFLAIATLVSFKILVQIEEDRLMAICYFGRQLRTRHAGRGIALGTEAALSHGCFWCSSSSFSLSPLAHSLG